MKAYEGGLHWFVTWSRRQIAWGGGRWIYYGNLFIAKKADLILPERQKNGMCRASVSIRSCFKQARNITNLTSFKSITFGYNDLAEQIYIYSHLMRSGLKNVDICSLML